MGHKIQVTLSDLYNGKSTKIRATRNMICDKCSGTGAKRAGIEATCKSCNGRGVRVITRQIGPGMIQRMESACQDCQGKGETIAEKDKCVKCRGKKVYPDALELDVNIEKGMKNGQKITFTGKAHQEPGLTPGDIIIIIQEKPHDLFIRKGDDLVMKRDLTLSEALAGYSFNVTHLDDRVLVIKSQPNDIVKPGDIRIIEGEGFPKHKNPFLKGNLYIKFNVVFPLPEQLNQADRENLAKILPPGAAKEMNDEEEHEECVARPFQEGVDQIGAKAADHRDATHSDEEETEGRNAQCVHQ